MQIENIAEIMCLGFEPGAAAMVGADETTYFCHSANDCQPLMLDQQQYFPMLQQSVGCTFMIVLAFNFT